MVLCAEKIEKQDCCRMAAVFFYIHDSWGKIGKQNPSSDS